MYQNIWKWNHWVFFKVPLRWRHFSAGRGEKLRKQSSLTGPCNSEVGDSYCMGQDGNPGREESFPDTSILLLCLGFTLHCIRNFEHIFSQTSMLYNQYWPQTSPDRVSEWVSVCVRQCACLYILRKNTLYTRKVKTCSWKDLWIWMQAALIWVPELIQTTNPAQMTDTISCSAKISQLLFGPGPSEFGFSFPFSFPLLSAHSLGFPLSRINYCLFL